MALSGNYYDPYAKDKSSGSRPKTFFDYIPSNKTLHNYSTNTNSEKNKTMEAPSTHSINQPSANSLSEPNQKQATSTSIHVEFHNTFNNVKDSLNDIYSKMVEVLTNAVHDSKIGTVH